MPPPPPEAQVIRLARNAMGMSAQKAADATKAHGSKGVSATYWRDVERGYGGRRGQVVAAKASDQALAAMAHVVGVAPGQLSEIGREGAAMVLAEILRREREHHKNVHDAVAAVLTDPTEKVIWETTSRSMAERLAAIQGLREEQAKLTAELLAKDVSDVGRAS